MAGRLGPSPPPTSAAVSKSMKGNKAKNTAPEVELRRLLRAAGYPGYRLHWNKVPGRPDIAFPGQKLAIFVNGCYWHRCPHCQPAVPKSNAEFWARKFELNVERDARKKRELEAAGWTVVMVWECRLKADPSGVVDAIVSNLR